ncbi:MAG: serine/threonine protein phosphatase, partial [Cyanobacteria bacterium M_surface_9_m1_291]|nr:serine/threonine protein phosphatase [Cyanobacteria bacterium M_surface_9_m1_291]
MWTASESLRQLLDSLSKEQRRNQDLLVSLAFGLRSFTNLARFLELVPLLTMRLVEGEGALLLVFHDDRRLWREQLQATAGDRCAEVLRQLAAIEDRELLSLNGEEALTRFLDARVARALPSAQLFATTIACRGQARGRLYVFSARPGFSWSEVHRRHVQLVADLTAVAIEHDALVQQMRRHERL